MYEVFEHTADLGLRIRGSSPAQLLQSAAEGLFAVIAGDLTQIRPAEVRSLHLPADELDYLLFDWLNELLYLFESERLLLSAFEVHLDSDGLRAEVRGETMDLARHRMDHEVKAITYHGLAVRQDDAGSWTAEVILDI